MKGVIAIGGCACIRIVQRGLVACSIVAHADHCPLGDDGRRLTVGVIEVVDAGYGVARCCHIAPCIVCLGGHASVLCGGHATVSIAVVERGSTAGSHS